MSFKDDSKVTSVEPPRVKAPNTNKMLDRMLESVGLQREGGGSA